MQFHNVKYDIKQFFSLGLIQQVRDDNIEFATFRVIGVNNGFGGLIYVQNLNVYFSYSIAHPVIFI